MRSAILASAVALACVISPASGSIAAQAQTSPRPTSTWTGRTAWGDPDLQGKWEVVETATPMERPKEFANREFLTDQQIAARTEAFKNLKQPDSDDTEAPRDAKANAIAPEHEKKIYGKEYNRFWVDPGQIKIRSWKRTSLVIDPPDGRMPPLTAEAIRRVEEREEARRGRGEADSWEDRNSGERCLQTAFARFGAGGGAGEVSVRQIIQAPGYVAIIVNTLNGNEPIVVPLDGRPRPSETVRTWLGVSRGRWEGSTLVLEATNINGKQDGGQIMPSRTPYQRFLGAGDTLHITERFTRVDADTIEYRYTVDDPKTYVRPYTVLRPLTKLDDNLLMPENGCHEGNYGIAGQLSAARADEKYALEAARAEAAARQPLLQEMKRRTEEWMRTRTQQR
jgi:hypothetical protein